MSQSPGRPTAVVSAKAHEALGWRVDGVPTRLSRHGPCAWRPELDG